MAAIAGNDRGFLTARLGALRLGTGRVGFAPKDTRGARYIWSRVVKGLTATWTAVKR